MTTMKTQFISAWICLCSLMGSASVSADDTNPSESALVVLNFSDDSSRDTDSEPLSPRDYFPLGMGIQKNSRVSLVPFCVAKNRTENMCTLAQYFEVEVGEYIDSDRVMDTRYGAPGDRVTGQTSAFHGKAIGSPFTGYIFSGGGFKESLERYLQTFKVPEKVSYGAVAGSSLLIEYNGVGGAALAGAVPGLLAGLFLNRESFRTGEGQWKSGWKGAVIGAVFPFAVYGVQTLVMNGQHRRTIRVLAKKSVRIENAFNLSRQIRENWTLSKGARVSERTYEAFVDFLNSTVQ